MAAVSRALIRSLLAAATLPIAALANPLWAACDVGDPRALVWLEKMSHSIHQTSYHGVVTLQRRDDMQVIQVSHLVDQGVSRERLTQLTGQGARVLRNAHPLNCEHPGQRLLHLSDDLQSGDCGITRYYRFNIDGGERVAGRPAVGIRVQPRDMYRYGYRFSLDRETGLLLKTETYGHGNKVLEKYQYANISYGEGGPNSGTADVVHRAKHPHPRQSSLASPLARAWTVKWLPRGFAATDSPVGVSGRRSFTDGLAVFSVFLEELDRELRPGEGVVREGGTTSYTRGMRVGAEPVLITVIGEVPVNTARMVADSVTWTQ